MKTELIPAIIAKNAVEALQKFSTIDPVAPWIQLDITDKTLVPNASWFDLDEMKHWSIHANLELHLMVQDPGAVIRRWLTMKRFKRAIWHMEAPVDHEKLIKFCRKNKIEPGLALSPETESKAILPYRDLIDEVLILGVHPGKSGRALVPAALKKIGELKRLAPKVAIGFDGHVTEKNLTMLIKKGANRLYMASAIFEQKEPAKFFKQMDFRLRENDREHESS